MSYPRALFIGMSPGAKNWSPSIPFLGTRSFKQLRSWCALMDIKYYSIANVSNKRNDRLRKKNWHDYWTFRLKPLLDDTDNYTAVVALGQQVSRILTHYGVEHFMLPHPSPLNRKLNRKDEIAEELKRCRSYALTKVPEPLRPFVCL